MKKESSWALLKAILENDVAKVEECLKNEKNPDRPDAQGITPLMHACRLGNLEIVQQLIDTENVNARHKSHSGQTPLSIAKEEKHDEIVKALEQHLKWVQDLMNTPMKECWENTVEEYLKQGADPDNFYRGIPLVFHTVRGNLEMVKILIKYGADIDKKTPCGVTAYDCAKKDPDLKEIKAYLESIYDAKKA